MPAPWALIAARQLSEDFEEEDTSTDLTIPAGFMFILICCCIYCGCRERMNAVLGCPEDSYCGIGSEQSGEACGSGCSIIFGTLEEFSSKDEVTGRVRV